MMEQTTTGIEPVIFPTGNTHQEQCLLDELQRLAPYSAKIYVGAITCLKAEGNPDRLSLAAHGFRELMRKFPNEISVPMLEHRQRLGDHVSSLRAKWSSTRQKTTSLNNSTWQGTIDKNLKTFLCLVDAFFNWYDNNHPRRKEETATFLARIDKNEHKLPELIEDMNAAIWQHIHNYFVAVAHHDSEADIHQMLKWKHALEDLLLHRLHPRTFADQDRIDRLLEV
jgi:hypothetical protein